MNQLILYVYSIWKLFWDLENPESQIKNVDQRNYSFGTKIHKAEQKWFFGDKWAMFGYILTHSSTDV